MKSRDFRKLNESIDFSVTKSYEDEQGNSLVGIADIILSKHRNGPIGDIQLKFKEESAKFVEMDALQPLSSPEPDGNGFTVESRMNSEGGDIEPPY